MNKITRDYLEAHNSMPIATILPRPLSQKKRRPLGRLLKLIHSYKLDPNY